MYDDERMSFSHDPEYPDVEVQLTGGDSNTGAIMGAVAQALIEAGHREAANEFRLAVFDCDSYEAVLQLAMNTVSVY